MIGPLALAGCASPEPVYRTVDAAALPGQPPAEAREAYYARDQILEIASNLLLFQREDGGWADDRDPRRQLSMAESYALIPEKSRPDATLAGGNIGPQIEYLAHVYLQTGDTRYRNGALRGLEFLLDSQLDNGGWPRSPNRVDAPLEQAIALTDGVMPEVLVFLGRVAEGRLPFGFVDREKREQVAEAVRSGRQFLLRAQRRTEAGRSGWAARYHPDSGEPLVPLLDTAVSVQVGAYLMSLSRPSPGVITAVQGLVGWLEGAAHTGSCLPGPALAREHWNALAYPDPLAVLYEGPFWRPGYAPGMSAPIGESSPPGLWPDFLLEYLYPAWVERHSL